jgi:hypothetical protein
LGLLFIRVADGASWADVFAAAAENYTTIRVNRSLFFAIDCFCFEGLHVAKLDTFTAHRTFGLINYWVPWYLATEDSFVIRFTHNPYSLLI